MVIPHGTSATLMSAETAGAQAEIEAGMRESLEAAGLREKPARRGRRVAAVE